MGTLSGEQKLQIKDIYWFKVSQQVSVNLVKRWYDKYRQGLAIEYLRLLLSFHQPKNFNSTSHGFFSQFQGLTNLAI